MSFRTLCVAAAAAIACMLGQAHAAFYVENTLGEVPAEERGTVSEPKPVQIIFQFTTSGAPNARATRHLNDRITELVTTSGFFSSVSTEPVEGGAILSITIDNIPQADAASRGFATGLTFGLAGTAVADYYEARVEYVPGADMALVRKDARHTLITTIGIRSAPENATRARNANEAIDTIVRQLMEHMLHDLVRDASFAGVPATAEPAPETMVEQAPADTAAPADAAAPATTETTAPALPAEQAAPATQPTPAPAQ